MSKTRRRDYLAYTLLFGCMALLVFSVFLLEGKSFIWTTGVDGINQHYLALTYEGIWLRDIAKSIMAGSPEVRFWDYTIGLGSDVISTFSYYVFGDPLTWVSALVPTRYTEYLYDALVVVRLWLAGGAFVLYCHRMGYEGIRVTVPAQAYAFCGLALYAAVRHPFFANPLIYLPLLLTGIENIYRENRMGLYVFSIFLSALSNFYFFYMLALCVAGYAFYRFFSFEHQHLMCELLVQGARFVGLALLGTVCAGILLVPTVFVLMSNMRASAPLQYDALYSVSYYLKFIPSMFSAVLNDYWKCLGYSGPVLLGIVALASEGKAKRRLLVAYVVLTTCFLIPAVGSFSNGMSYVTNRWCFAYSMFVCFVLVMEWQALMECPRPVISGIGISAIVLFVLISLTALYVSSVSSLASFATLLVAAIVLLCARSAQDATDSRVVRKTERVFAALLLFGIVGNAYGLYSVYGYEYVSEFLDSGAGARTFDQTDWKRIQNQAQSNSYDNPVRGEYSGQQGTIEGTEITYPQKNYNAFSGVSTSHYYWSVVNSATSEYLSELGLANFRSYSSGNLNGRSIPMALLGMRYDLCGANYAPYGFEPVEGQDALYVNNDPLPVGYTYASVLPQSVYERLDQAHEQEAMLQAAVVDDASACKPLRVMADTDLAFDHTKVTQTLRLEGVNRRIDDTHYLCVAGSHMVIDFEGVPASETYLQVKGLAFEAKTDNELYRDDDEELFPTAEYESLSTITKNKLKWSEFTSSHWSNTTLNFPVKSGDISTTLIFTSPYDVWTDGINTFLVNLGYHDEPLNQVDIEIPVTGVYTFEDLSVVCQPFDKVGQQLDQLKQQALENVWFANNAFGGDVTVSEPRLLVLTMPYSEGWRATVDGQEVDIMRANRVGMGIMLDAGSHSVQLTYAPAGLRLGLASSAGGLLVWALLMVWQRKRSRRDTQREAA